MDHALKKFWFPLPKKNHALMVITRSLIFDGKKLQLRVWNSRTRDAEYSDARVICCSTVGSTYAFATRNALML